MQIIYPEDLPATLVNLMLIAMVFFFVVLVPFFLLMHFIMPKKLLEKYWSTEYFQSWELAFFHHFPSSLIRTVMLTSAMTFPFLGKKRKLADLHTSNPKWYRNFVKLYTISFLATSAYILLSMVGLGIYTFIKDLKV